MGVCAITGCGSLSIDYTAGTATTEDGIALRRGDIITLDGTSGEVMLGDIAKTEASSSDDFQELLSWADKHRRLKVRANAETPEDAARARELGAEGIGLCRTEHMFFAADRIDIMRAMILSETIEERQTYLGQLLVFQHDDMLELFKVMDRLPVTIRLLDPPLHEFLPQTVDDIDALANRIGKPANQIREITERLAEVNPMLGFRGCRLSVVYPEIAEMQVKAIISAAADAMEAGYHPLPEIMIPLETPRATLGADRLAPEVEFMSFGTNDLTQMTYGFSRDDAGKFIPKYLKEKLIDVDPFVSLDQRAVGRLMELAIKESRARKKGIKYGICGEHGGDPRSIRFCHDIGLDYVSCSPFRVPIARIAAAQANVASERDR
jgi:pyruvate,orthophosphate dikinase